jgi:hypothetical protein
LFLLGLPFLAACTGMPTGPSSPLNAEFTLGPSETLRIEDTELAVRFNQVSGDSRCPADVFCVHGGSASVEITAISGNANRDYQLRTGDMKAVQHDGFTIALVHIDPYPFSSHTIPPGEYRATLKVTR